MSGHTHTYIHTYIHTYPRENYGNPRCALARRGLIILKIPGLVWIRDFEDANEVGENEG